MDKFKLVSDYKPAGDQPKAIKELTDDIKKNKKYNVLLGATGTGKTFSIAHIINNLQKNTLIMVHNKTLAGQLYSEFKQLFPNNKVEYFISYFDFYQPEAYLPRSDTYIEKSSKANQEIEMLRLSTLNSLVNSDKVIVVASVAAIYGASNPDEFNKFKLTFVVNQEIKMRDFQDMIAKLNYSRSLDDLAPGTFRNKGDVIEISPS
jgi:excinuclease ABC subunit B